MKRLLCLLLLAVSTLPAPAAQPSITLATLTNDAVTVATNVFVSHVGQVLPIHEGAVGVSAYAYSPSNHSGTTIHFFFQSTIDGTNWAATNSILRLIATVNTTNLTTHVPSVTNFTRDQVGGLTAIRAAGYTVSTVTNTVISNLVYSTLIQR